MNVKIQGGGKNAGVYANTGSAAALVEYLEHEDKERLAEGLDILPFFNGQGFEVERGEVLQKLDRNHKKLHYEDAKFYHLDINPSQEELRAMGATEEEIIANCKVLAVKLTQLYADNFNKDIVVGKDKNGNNITRRLSGEDIMIFWKVHTTRNEKDGLQVHIHGIPSRKDIHNKYQLSPATAHRNTSKGPVTGGFERTRFYSEVERVFDETFGYTRVAEETFTYCNEQKKAERRERKIEVNVEEIKKEKRKDLAIALPQQDNKIKDALARRDLRRRNEFWNEYHSKYRPMYEGLKGACDKSFALYKDAKDNCNVCNQAISAKYDELRGVYRQMNAAQAEIQAAKGAKGLWTAVSALVFIMNPIAGIVMGLTSRIITEANVSANTETRQQLRAQAQQIKYSIEQLKAQQEVLREDKADKLKAYVENKEAKIELQQEINTLKAELDKPLKQESAAEKNFKSQLAAYAYEAQILSVFKQSKDMSTLCRNLEAKGLTMSVTRNGHGIEDITVKSNGGTSFEVKVSNYGKNVQRQILDSYYIASGQVPAYKAIEANAHAQRIRQAQEATRLAVELKAQAEAQKQAQAEVQRKAAEQAQAEAQRKAAEQAQAEMQRKAAEQAQKVRVQQKPEQTKKTTGGYTPKR